MTYVIGSACVDVMDKVGAIEWETDLPDDERWHIDDNAAFFQTALPGRADRWVISVARNPLAGWVSTPRWWRRYLRSRRLITEPDALVGSNGHQR
jgi:hypothetical protein